MARKAKQRFERLSKGELREYIAQRLAAGDSYGQIARDLGYRSSNSVVRMAREEDVVFRVAKLKEQAASLRAASPEGGAASVPSGPGVEPAAEVGGSGPAPADVAGKTLDDCMELAEERLYEVLKYGTFLGRRVDPEKVGMKAILEALTKAAKARAEGEANGSKPGAGGILNEERLKQLAVEELGPGQAGSTYIPGQTVQH